MKKFMKKWAKKVFKRPFPQDFKNLSGSSFQETEAFSSNASSSFKKLQDLTLGDVMIPRADIIAIDGRSSFSEIVHLFLETKAVALPVFKETLDNIVGILRIHDVLTLKEKGQTSWQRKVCPVSFAPSSMSALEALTLLKERRDAFLLVVDEYGGVDGLASLEKLLHEMGDYLNIWEEEEFFETVQRGDGAYVVDGRLSLDTFEEEFGSFLSSAERKGEVETIGGLACALAGRVPLRGEAIPHTPSGLLLEIVEADPRRVKRVAVHIPPAPKTTP